MQHDSTTDRELYQTADPIIEIRDAEVVFDMERGVSRVLDNANLDLERNEILGVVGESGSGKSMLASALLDAVVDPGILSGEITYHPEDRDPINVLELDDQELKQLRWEDISMVFQGAMSSFNPTMSVGAHFEETLSAHHYDIDEGMARAHQLLSDLYLEPERVLESYPHELSGGMKQRALIALSVILEPDVLVMDEPTAALDLLMQRSILSLLEGLQEKYDLTLLFITHDLPLVAELADRMAVMYAFEMIEIGATDEILGNAAHPYTRALLNSTPNLDAPLSEMQAIEGSAPDPVNVPAGCSYHPRCPLSDEECESSDPDYQAVSDQHNVACYHWQQAAAEIPFNIDGEVETNTTMHNDTTEYGRGDPPRPDTADPAGDDR
ncbi:ABC transporter ATP-binding protein [Natronolimnobius sp. AArcel1]|uniref:oligopeptide/dipeptide ABC transporter ATP-binding protein n=1 Tax=Natronolimnobius sp. AArcel1 TaxID=1679093 RepID=UPI0013EB3F5A|nr:ABC transporter ATP-binding protein [Natronolimnobius sp. AArcel1]